MRRCLLALALCAVAVTVDAAPLLRERSEIRFVGTQMNVPVKGEFKQFSGDIRFDPARPEASSAEVVVQTGSIDIGLDEGNLTLQQPEWFSAEAFPQARFVASGFKALGGERYEARGTLSIKGMRLPVTVPLTVRRGADGAWTAGGEFVVRRLPFQLGIGDWADTSVVGDEVRISLRLTVAGQ